MCNPDTVVWLNSASSLLICISCASLVRLIYMYMYIYMNNTCTCERERERERERLSEHDAVGS